MASATRAVPFIRAADLTREDAELELRTPPVVRPTAAGHTLAVDVKGGRGDVFREAFIDALRPGGLLWKVCEIQGATHVEYLNVSDIHLLYEEFRALCRCIASWPQLPRSIRLAYLGIEDSYMVDGLIPLLCESNNPPEELVLSRNCFGPDSAMQLVETLGRRQAECEARGLRITCALDLRSCWITDAQDFEMKAMLRASTMGIQLSFPQVGEAPILVGELPQVHILLGPSWRRSEGERCLPDKLLWEAYMAGPASMLGFVLEKEDWREWTCQICKMNYKLKVPSHQGPTSNPCPKWTFRGNLENHLCGDVHRRKMWNSSGTVRANVLPFPVRSGREYYFNCLSGVQGFSLDEAVEDLDGPEVDADTPCPMADRIVAEHVQGAQPSLSDWVPPPLPAAPPLLTNGIGAQSSPTAWMPSLPRSGLDSQFRWSADATSFGHSPVRPPASLAPDPPAAPPPPIVLVPPPPLTAPSDLERLAVDSHAGDVGADHITLITPTSSELQPPPTPAKDSIAQTCTKCTGCIRPPNHEGPCKDGQLNDLALESDGVKMAAGDIGPSAAISAQTVWRKFVADDGRGAWWWRESDGDWFLEEQPGEWAKYVDPTGGKYFWHRVRDDEFFYVETGAPFRA